MSGELMTGRDALVARLEDEIASLRRELAEKDQAVTDAAHQNETAVGNLRRQLGPLYKALQQVFGEIEAIAPGDNGESPSGGAGSAVEPRIAAVWSAWKTKLSPSCGRVIDALLIHGELSGPQICIAAKMSKNTLHGGVLSQLNKAGLLTKNGGRFSLKQL